MGSLADHAPQVRSKRPSPGPKCGLLRNVERLDQADADALVALIYVRLDLTTLEVVGVLAEHGIDLDKEVIKRHRQGRCHKCREVGAAWAVSPKP